MTLTAVEMKRFVQSLLNAGFTPEFIDSYAYYRYAGCGSGAMFAMYMSAEHFDYIRVF